MKETLKLKLKKIGQPYLKNSISEAMNLRKQIRKY